MTDSRVLIGIFSYNRPEFLRNCLDSAQECMSWAEIRIYDDGSTDPGMLELLEEVKGRGDVAGVFVNELNDGRRLGGLHANMNLALEHAVEGRKDYLLLMQDDMQFVRHVGKDELDPIDRFFDRTPNAVMLYGCFFKGINEERDRKNVIWDQERAAYFYRRDRGFADVGILNVNRWKLKCGKFGNSEMETNRLALQAGLVIGIYDLPFMMYLPFPRSYRNKRKPFLMRLSEKIARVGLYPWRILTAHEVDGLRSMEKSDNLLVAERYLLNDGLNGRPEPWLYGAVIGPRKLLRQGRIGRFLGKLDAWLGRYWTGLK